MRVLGLLMLASVARAWSTMASGLAYGVAGSGHRPWRIRGLRRASFGTLPDPPAIDRLGSIHIPTLIIVPGAQ